MEWAYELILGYRRGDARVRDLVSKTRTIVVPIVNPDGFNASREAGELFGNGGGHEHRPGRQRRGRRPRVPARGRDPPERVPAQELPLPGGPADGQLRGRRRGRRRARRRPEPQLRRVLGRRRLERRLLHADLPRPGAVLRARVAEHPRAGLGAPGHDADHEPHVLRSRAASARHRRAGHDRRRADLQGARRLDGRRERLLEPVRLPAVRHDRDDRGLVVQRDRRPRVHLRDRPPRLPPAVRGHRQGVERHHRLRNRRREPGRLLQGAGEHRRREQALGADRPRSGRGDPAADEDVRHADLSGGPDVHGPPELDDPGSVERASSSGT